MSRFYQSSALPLKRPFRWATLSTFCALALALSARAEKAYQSWPVEPTTGLRAEIYDLMSDNGAYGNAIAFDARGNVYITGYATGANSTDPTYYTAKYDALDGHVIWSQVYSNGESGGDQANALAVDSQGNVIVTGQSYNADNTDIETIKYRASDGAVLWSKRYDNGGADIGLKVIVDGSDNAIVIGKSVANSYYDWVTIKYAASNGAPVWANPAREAGGGHVDDVPTGVTLGFGTIVVTGEVVRTLGGNQSWATVAYNPSTGGIVWGPLYYQDASGNDSGATAIVKDGASDLIVTGFSTNADSSQDFHTIKYDYNGNFVWGQTVSTSGNYYPYGPTSIGVDSQDNPVVTGTDTINGTQYYHTVKYQAAAPGTEIWDNTTANVTFAGGDYASQLVVDGSDNTIVTGGSTSDAFNTDYFTMCYAFDGTLLWTRRLDAAGQADMANGVAVDGSGNVAITGTAEVQNTGGTFSARIVTTKYNRVTMETGDPVFGAGSNGISQGALYSALNTPAIGDNSALSVRVSAGAGHNAVTGIYDTGAGGPVISAVQGQTPPGESTGKYKSFYDPIVTPDGHYAFEAKLTGPKPTPSAALFSNITTALTTDELEEVLGVGKQVTGLPTGVLLQSITSYAGRGSELLALIKVTGKSGGVTGANSTALMGFIGSSGYSLLRTGDPLTVNGVASTIKTISALLPSVESPGDGRSQGNNRIAANVTLADKRSVVVTVAPTGGTPTSLLYSGQDASFVRSSATFKSFGEPAIDGAGAEVALLCTLTPKVGGVTAADDTALIYSSNNSTFSYFAREGDPAPINNATYASFFDPLVNDQGDIAFLATLKGTASSAKTALFFGAPGNPYKVAQLGDKAPNTDGTLGTATISGFVSVALPNGTDSGPVFLAKLSGSGVTAKNNLAIFALDSVGVVNGTTTNNLRRLMTIGDVLPTGADPDPSAGTPVPTETISKVALLSAIPPVAGQTRNLNDGGAVAVLVTFSDKHTAVIVVGTP